MEDLRLRLDDAGSLMTEDHFMTQILNSLIDDYLLEVKLMEKRISGTREPFTIEEMKSELSLAYERLANHGKKPVDYDGEETVLALYSQFKGKCNNCGKIGHKAVNCRSQESNNQATNRNGYGGGRFGNRNRNGAGGRGFSGECRKKRADGGESALAAVDRGDNRGHQRWGGKAPYNGKVDEGDVVLAMIEIDDPTELPDFGSCDDIFCDDNKEEFACMAFVCDKEYYRAISTVRDQKNKKFLSEGRVIESFEIYLILCFREIPTVRAPTANNQP
jgi:hypothetical protein